VVTEPSAWGPDFVLRVPARWLHDESIASHPRYRAVERRLVLRAVRGGSVTLIVVLAADAVLLFPQAPGLWLVNAAGVLATLAVLRATRRTGDGRRNPSAGALVLGVIAIATTLVPMALTPTVAALMVAYMPVVIIAAALFVPWSTRWHVPWLALSVGTVTLFASSPLAGALSPSSRSELVTISIAAALVSFAGHLIRQRERYRAFRQWMQLRGLNEVARRQRREMAALAAQLEAVARRDPLTGIGNRLRLEEDVVALRDGPTTRESSAAILLDLDHFKRFNDRHGHLAGDRVLRDVARTIAVNVRPSDRVYRFGGEEFLILLEGTDAATATLVAERVRSAVEQLGIEHPDNPPWATVTLSAGVAAVDLGEGEADAWVRIADERLYDAKSQGRNRVIGPGAPAPAPRLTAANEPAA
jgi:diguanylate cyclase (GGDEF)-like protein